MYIKEKDPKEIITFAITHKSGKLDGGATWESQNKTIEQAT